MSCGFWLLPYLRSICSYVMRHFCPQRVSRSRPTSQLGRLASALGLADPSSAAWSTTVWWSSWRRRASKLAARRRKASYCFHLHAVGSVCWLVFVMIFFSVRWGLLLNSHFYLDYDPLVVLIWESVGTLHESRNVGCIFVSPVLCLPLQSPSGTAPCTVQATCAAGRPAS